jgi:hypothetical protein
MSCKWISPEMLATLKRQTYMSDSTWQKIIASDPEGWSEMLNLASEQKPANSRQD